MKIVPQSVSGWDTKTSKPRLQTGRQQFYPTYNDQNQPSNTQTNLLPSQIREERRKELADHVLAVKQAIESANGVLDNPSQLDSDNDNDSSTSDNEEWTGISDPKPTLHDAEYIDEDAYATVTVESVDITKDGFEAHNSDSSAEEEDDEEKVVAAAAASTTAATDAGKLSGEGKKRVWTKDKPLGLRRPSKKKREKKFRYESKTERRVNRDKQRVKNKTQAAARKAKAGE